VRRQSEAAMALWISLSLLIHPNQKRRRGRRTPNQNLSGFSSAKVR